MALKNIIFDLGGVLLNIDYNKTADAFKELGVKNFDEMYAQFKVDELFDKLETGHISEDLFYETMSGRGNEQLTRSQIQASWNAMLLDFRKESFLFVCQLKHRYNVYLLSNTNVIHKAAFDKEFTAQTGLPSIESCFTKAYFSHLAGLRKPHSAIYQYVLQDAGIEASETLFIDDSENNLEEAEKLGIKTHLLLPGERIENLDYEQYHNEKLFSGSE